MATTDSHHAKLNPNNGGTHVTQSLEYADAAARLAATGFTALDKGRVAHQLDDDSFWMLVNHAPATWEGVVFGGRRDFELGENLSAGDPVEVYDDAGTPKVREVFSILGNKDNWPTAGADTNIFAASVTVDTNKIAVAYRDVGAAATGYLVVGNVQPDNSVVWGTPVQFEATTTSEISICRIDTNKVAVVYRNSTSQGRAIAATIAGTVPTFGASVQFSATTAFNIDSDDINTDKFVVAYRDSSSSNEGTARVGSVVGTVITFGAALAFNPGTFTFSIKCARAAADKFVAFYRGPGNVGLGRAATVTGTTINPYGATAQFNSGVTTVQGRSQVATDKVVVAYQDNSNGNKGTLCVGTLVGTMITFGAEFEFTDAVNYYASVDRLQDDELVLVYAEDSTFMGFGRGASVTGTNISFTSPQQYQDFNTRYPNVAAIDSATFWLAWADSTNVNFGLVVDVLNITTLGKTAGILETGGSAGDVRPVTLVGGVTGALAGMTAGEVMYIQPDSSISNVESPNQIGLALAADAMLVFKNEVFQ